jgi:DNA-directed RNA polymerase subunit RPC12/RpoP
MKKVLLLLSLLVFTAGMLSTSEALAQTADKLSLRLSRTFGYSSGTGDIQGTFKLTASGPDNLAKVVFYLDDQVMGEVTQPPFALSFSTDSYPNGLHTLKAVGTTADGTQIQSNAIQGNFVPAGQGMQAAGRIILPLLSLVIVLMLLSFFVPVLLRRGKLEVLAPGTPRNYGIKGGAICPRCQRPFVLHMFGVNLGPNRKYERCPYCGRMGIVKTSSLKDLRAAEAAELEQANLASQMPEESEEDKLRKELENSRYRDV